MELKEVEQFFTDKWRGYIFKKVQAIQILLLPHKYTRESFLDSSGGRLR